MPLKIKSQGQKNKRKNELLRFKVTEAQLLPASFAPEVNLGRTSAVLTVSNISRVCAADTQNRALDSVIGVAGNPTTTTPIFFFNMSLAKALRKEKVDREKSKINYLQ